MQDLANTQSMQLKRQCEQDEPKAEEQSAPLPQALLDGVAAPPGEGVIKAEKLTPEEALAEEVKALLSDPIPTKLKLQGMEVECDKLMPIAKQNPLMATYADALDKHNQQVRKMLQGITRVVQGSETNGKKMPQLLAALHKIYERHTQLVDFATLNNLTTKKRRQRK